MHLLVWCRSSTGMPGWGVPSQGRSFGSFALKLIAFEHLLLLELTIFGAAAGRAWIKQAVADEYRRAGDFLD
jgi:hypothetical protein